MSSTLRRRPPVAVMAHPCEAVVGGTPQLSDTSDAGARVRLDRCDFDVPLVCAAIAAAPVPITAAACANRLRVGRARPDMG